MMRFWRKNLLIVMLGGILLVGVRAAEAYGMTPRSACRFIQYYQALESRSIGLWERVLYSFFLAGASQPRAEGATLTSS